MPADEERAGRAIINSCHATGIARWMHRIDRHAIKKGQNMTAATLLAMALATGGVPCRTCGPDGQPSRPGLIYHHACDGGKCFSCRQPLYGSPSAPPFDYRLIFNYPWSQAPSCPPHAAMVRPAPYRQPEPIEAMPLPPPPMPATGTAPNADSVTVRTNAPSSRRTTRSSALRASEVARKPKASPTGGPSLDRVY